MTTREQWIEKTMESLDGLQRVPADPDLRDAVIRRIQHREARGATLRTAVLLRIAAGVALLVTLNVVALFLYSQKAATIQANNKTLATEYFSYLDTIIL
jgi:hypothetical protein